jgi:DNA/RNA endonuclease YhcR with UshA esterase domain
MSEAHMRQVTVLLLFLCFAAQVGAATFAVAEIVTPEEAAKMVGKEVTVEFKVQATGAVSNLVFLNSETDRNGPKNFTVVLQESAVDELAKEKIAKPRDHYKGKTVLVTGKIELYQDKPQIKVTKASQIKVK